jgi:broad specificity phosphatase PhoE
MVRERLGLNPCDRHSAREVIEGDFPWANLSTVPAGVDTLWTQEHRETLEELDARATVFLRWLRARPERKLVVVSHDGFLYHTFRMLTACGVADAAAYEDRRFSNCEVRRVTVDRASLP